MLSIPSQELCSRMSRIGLAPVFQQKEFSSLRSHYQHAFVKLIKISQVILPTASFANSSMKAARPSLGSCGSAGGERPCRRQRPAKEPHSPTVDAREPPLSQLSLPHRVRGGLVSSKGRLWRSLQVRCELQFMSRAFCTCVGKY